MCNTNDEHNAYILIGYSNNFIPESIDFRYILLVDACVGLNWLSASFSSYENKITHSFIHSFIHLFVNCRLDAKDLMRSCVLACWM